MSETIPFSDKSTDDVTIKRRKNSSETLHKARERAVKDLEKKFRIK